MWLFAHCCEYQLRRGHGKAAFLCVPCARPMVSGRAQDTDRALAEFLK
jgi:hypothetical protein